MKLAWPSGRGRQGSGVRRNAGGTCSSAFSGPASAGIADTKHNLGSGPGLRAQPGLGHRRDLRVLPHAARRGHRRARALWNKRLGANGTHRRVAAPTPPTTRCRRRRWTAPWRRWARSRWPACRATTARRRWTTSSTRRARAATTSPAAATTAARTPGPARPSTRPAACPAARAARHRPVQRPPDRHPVLRRRPHGSGTTVTGTCKDGDFRRPIDPAVINGNQIFWVDTGTCRHRLEAAHRPAAVHSATTGGLGPMVECASCHDPHVSTGPGRPGQRLVAAGETFLRISNASSAVCTACHVK